MVIDFISVYITPENKEELLKLVGTDIWQHNAQIGNSRYEVSIKTLDDLDKALFLISLGLDTKELQEMIDGDLLDTF